MNKKTSTISIVVMVTLAIFAIGGYLFVEHNLNGYPDTRNFTKRVAELDNKPNQKTVLIFHKPGCSRCKKARAVITQTIKENPQRHYIVINVDKAGARELISKYGVMNFPTLIVLQGNRVVNSTDSTDAKLITKLMTGV